MIPETKAKDVEIAELTVARVDKSTPTSPRGMNSIATDAMTDSTAKTSTT